MFRYIFYRIYCLYKFRFKDDIPLVYAIAILTLAQSANIMSFFFMYSSYSNIELKTIINSKTELVIGMVVLITINYLIHVRFFDENKLFIFFERETAKLKKVRGYLAFFYITLSVVLFFYLAVKIGGEAKS